MKLRQLCVESSVVLLQLKKRKLHNLEEDGITEHIVWVKGKFLLSINNPAMMFLVDIGTKFVRLNQDSR